MNYNFANRGTLYLLDTIELICCANNSMELMENIERKVYTQIAKKYNKNPLTIKSNIIKATNNMYNFNCNRYFINIISDSNFNKTRW